MTDERIREEIKNNNVDFVQIETEDLHGISRGLTLDVDYFLKSYLHGIPFFLPAISVEVDGTTVENTGFQCEIDYANGTLYADLSTFTVTPWKSRTASVYCDFKLEYGNPESANVEISSRALCKAQLKKLKELGYNLYSAMEYEFYVVDKNTKKRIYEDENLAATWVNDKTLDFGYDIMTNMKKVGIKPEAFHSEGGASELEITLSPEFGIIGPDNAMRFKSITKYVCLQRGYSALFLTQPFPGKYSTSGSFNHSLWSLDKTSNLFYDVKQPYKLSLLAQNWLAGLQEHANGLMCLACTTYNCYERKPLLTPSDNSWGLDNRSVGFRVKNLSSTATYIENRIPGAAVNSYLITAGCIIAGMDGIERNLQLKTPPYKGDISKAERLPVNVEALPRSLSEALECLNNDKLLVEGLGESFIKAFITIKKQEIKSACGNESDLWGWYLQYYGDSI